VTLWFPLPSAESEGRCLLRIVSIEVGWNELLGIGIMHSCTNKIPIIFKRWICRMIYQV
jgi:hypothetical protein